MKGLIRGAAGLVAVLAFSGCGTDQTIELMGPPTGIQATPSSAFTLKGDSATILVRMVNDRNQAVPTKFEISNVGSAISVAYDSKYRPDYTSGDTLGAPDIKPQQRYFAKGLATGTATFTITSGGLSTTVTIVVRPKDLGPALNKTTGLTYGDTVTITATDGLKFTPTTAISFATGLSYMVPPAASDSTTRKVVLGAGTGGIATATNVFQSYAPTLAKVSLATTNAVTATPALAQPTMAPTTGLVAGSVVTITAGAGTVFSRTPVITFATGGLAIQSVSADSTTVNIIVGPGIAGAATITKMGIIKGPLVGVYTVTTANTLAAIPAIAVAPTTVSDAAPNIGVTTTITLGGGLRFLPTSHVKIGGKEAGIQSISADSSQAVVMPQYGSNGNVTYTGIVLSFLNTVGISVPGDKTVTVGNVFAGTTDPLSNALATAPTLNLAGGRAVVIADGGTIGTVCPAGITAALGGDATCRFYKATVVANTMFGDLNWDAPANRDLGIYIFNAAGTSCLSWVADDAGRQSGLTGEHSSSFSCTSGAAAPLAAGSVLIVVANFHGSEGPVSWFSFRLSQP